MLFAIVVPGIVDNYQQSSGDETSRIVSIGTSWTRKVLSGVRIYGESRDLAFFLYERQFAHRCFAAHSRAQQLGVTADVLTRDSQTSTSYWEIVQDSLADLCRIMLERCHDEENFPELTRHCRGLRGSIRYLCAFPNLFITIAPAEWKFPRPFFLDPYKHCVFACAYILALHMYFLVRCMWYFLANRFGHRFFRVLEWVMKTEYQERRTPHWHIAAWVISPILEFLAGRTGTAVVSAFVKFLSLLFRAEIDVQIGNGRINYISGYVAKDHDAVDVGFGEYVQKSASSPWLCTYRLLAKSTPGIPEVGACFQGGEEGGSRGHH